jgi:hypothetical protein
VSDLVDYSKEYAPSRFKLPDGEPLKKRSQQILAKKFRLPLIRVGRTNLIDPALGDERLRQYALEQLERKEAAPRGRGRPRSRPLAAE